MRVLLVKLTSMGDLIHALPALTDAAQAVPGVTFDWVIEKSFSEVASWHPAVNKIIPTSHRKWRKQLWQSRGEIREFLTSLRAEKYDLIIDGQSSMKSAVTTFLAKGTRCGLDKKSAREAAAAMFYQRHYAVDKDMHAIKRLRLLFAQVFGYAYQETQPDYGIANVAFPAKVQSYPQPYLMFVHNTSWLSKLWPESHWRQMISFAANEGFNVVLPWGNDFEHERAQRIAAGFANAHVLPRSSLADYAAILKGAHGAICSDTGISHMAAALNVPALTMYGPTSAKLIGTTGLNQMHHVSDFGCTNCYKYKCQFGGNTNAESACLVTITPEVIWQQFKAL